MAQPLRQVGQELASTVSCVDAASRADAALCVSTASYADAALRISAAFHTGAALHVPMCVAAADPSESQLTDSSVS